LVTGSISGDRITVPESLGSPEKMKIIFIFPDFARTVR
jgi:hypothetical protein